MKKVYISLLLSGIVCLAQAQRTGNVPALNNFKPVLKQGQLKALGDTLFEFDGTDFFLSDPDDITDFDYDNLDLDNLTPAASSSWTSDWLFFYSTDPADFLPGDTDTAYYMGSPSWFNPPGQADDWFIVGPITIPAGGAKLTWYERHNPAYSDGYKVYAATSGRVPYTDVLPGTTPALYTKATIVPPATQPSADTAWQQKNASLNSFAGNRVYVFFHHDANDADLLQLDQMVITENANQSVTESSNMLGVKVYPNPANSQVTFSLNLANAAITEIELVDITGKVVMVMEPGKLNAGTSVINRNLEDLGSGVYFYTVRSGEFAKTGKLVITH